MVDIPTQVVICAYCGHRGKGITLRRIDHFMTCDNLVKCNDRRMKLKPSQLDWLETERLKIFEQQDNQA